MPQHYAPVAPGALFPAGRQAPPALAEWPGWMLVKKSVQFQSAL